MSSEQAKEEDRARRLMAMGQMAASLAHEIRNPLGSMELYCTLLKKDLSGLPKSFELAEQIHSGIKILDRIISNCLQFSRDLVPKRKRITDTSELIDETFTCVQAKAEEAGVRLTFEEKGENELCIDSYLVHQALVNLILNSIEASQEQASADSLDQPESVVVVESDRQNADSWFISVRDNGPGITQIEQERIFDPFFTTKNDGTGLGLAIVHSIVAAHSGHVAISSVPGRGTTVTMEFPFSV